MLIINGAASILNYVYNFQNPSFKIVQMNGLVRLRRGDGRFLSIKKRNVPIFGFFEKMLIWRSDLEELEYPEHLENLINRKITIFYIEAIPKKISQLRKKYIFFQPRTDEKNIFFLRIEKISTKFFVVEKFFG